MPTESRTDYFKAYKRGQDGKMQYVPSQTSHTAREIAKQDWLNASDEAIVREAARILAIPICNAKINFYGEQMGPSSVAVVSMNGFVVEIPIAEGLPTDCTKAGRAVQSNLRKSNSSRENANINR